MSWPDMDAFLRNFNLKDTTSVLTLISTGPKQILKTVVTSNTQTSIMKKETLEN
eukprot:CAMPEP_0174274532 /NCGR_PEP_ID=MMETSP0439-20130205/58269_1 /TAXON_ID=0 /ORGANISM="Stereomyxa ramosa, Strain Chinc5" /LENGTH=53 /DNA_ID=CAMNT_0015366339 /DNA_START=35 /DNA_END=193 /DNA_ORIENTATION=+